MTEKRLALIIASYQYQDTDLRQLVAPAQDAEALARVLKDPTIGSFEVQTLLNEPSYKVNQEIETFFADRRRNDLLLLYFSSHGIKDEEGRLYFATTDTRRKLLRTTAVPATLVNDVMRYSRSRRQVLLLDCCYSGAFARGMVAKADKAIGTQERFEGRGRVVLTASDAMQYAFEGDEIVKEGVVRSLFTRILVQGLETGEADLNGDGRISPDELYNYVYERVTDETPQQRPGMWAFDVGGEIIIAHNPAPPAPKVSLPGWITEALASSAYSARLAAVGELDRLSQGEDQALAAIARAELERLSQEDESSIVRGAAAGALGVSPVAVPAKPSPAPPVEVKKPPPKPEPELELHPSLALQLSVKPQTVDAGGEATWTVTLRNDGDDDLRQVTVRRGLTLLDEPFDLAVGKERRFTFTTTYKTEGKKTEKVTMTGIASNGERVRDEVSVGVQVRPPRPVIPKPEPAPRRKPPARPVPDVLTITSPIHLELVRVPAGEFLMGSDPAKDKGAEGDEQPQHRVYVSEFYIGKYPVTNAQYEVFVQTTGHRVPNHWKRFLRKAKVPSGKENHPVFQVSWDDAVAFCQWLSQKTRKSFRLPTEAEWEKAARGTDGRIFPWGNEWDETKLNSCEAGPGDTTLVGQYSPAGDSPYRAADMSGNVLEWCADWYDEEEYQRRKSTVKDPQGPGRGTSRVLRGGAFFYGRGDFRCAYRYRRGPDLRLGYIGFRVMVSPVSSGL